MLAGISGRRLIPGLVALVSTVGLGAVQIPQTEPFRAAVDLVRLDFLALAQDGRPVTDLSAADVTARDWTTYQGKILRMELDGAIPADNPAIGGVRSHIYS